MTRTIPGGIDLTVDTTLAMCVQITDRLGVVRGFTEHDKQLAIDLSDGNGSITYEPDSAFTRTAIEARSGGRTGSSNLIGYVDSTNISESDVQGRIFDSAFIRFFLVDWTDISKGIIDLDVGDLEETKQKDDQIEVTFKNLLDRYNSNQIGDTYSVDCIHILGSKPDDSPRPFANIGCRVQLNPPTWAAGVEVLARSAQNAAPTGFETSGSPTQVNTVQPSVPNGFWFEAEIGGTTGGAEPTWVETLGASTVDNTVTWTAVRALRETADVSSVTDQKTFDVDLNLGTGPLTFFQNFLLDSGSTMEQAAQIAYEVQPDNWYRKGYLQFTSGANNGLAREIKTQIALGGSPTPPAGFTITTHQDFPFTIAIGDAVVLVAGCDKLLTTCIDKFRNRRHFGGFAVFAPINDEIFKIPKIPA